MQLLFTHVVLLFRFLCFLFYVLFLLKWELDYDVNLSNQGREKQKSDNTTGGNVAASELNLDSQNDMLHSLSGEVQSKSVISLSLFFFMFSQVNCTYCPFFKAMHLKFVMVLISTLFYFWFLDDIQIPYLFTSILWYIVQRSAYTVY